jgi:hypothetical protein
MKKRYFVLGAAVVLAISLTVPALGGPPNPVSSAAKSVKSKANKALKKAKKANQNAKAAQSTANQALNDAGAAQTTANGAQTAAEGAQTAADAAQTAAEAAQATADQALAEAQTPTATKLGLQTVTDSSPSNSNDKSAIAVCPAGKDSTGGWGFTSATPDVKFQGTLKFYEATVALGFEDPATASNWTVTAQAACINE